MTSIAVPNTGPACVPSNTAALAGAKSFSTVEIGVRMTTSLRTLRNVSSGGSMPVTAHAPKPVCSTHASTSLGSQVMPTPKASSTEAAVKPRLGGTQRSESSRTLAPAPAATKPAATSSGGK